VKSTLALALCLMLGALGCRQPEPPPPPGGVQVVFPGGRVNVNDGGTNVSAPGTQVNAPS